MGSRNGKNRLTEGHLRFLSKFPFINLQIKSIVESLRPIMSCTQSMKKKISDLLKTMHVWIKNRFSEISLKFIRICWSDIIDSIGFLEAVDRTSCLSCLEIISNGP